MIKKVLVVGAMCLAAATAVVTTELPVSAAQVSENVYEVTVTPGCTDQDIQALLNLNANGQYSELLINFPAGEYKLDSTLFVYSNTTLKAASGSHFVKQQASGALLEGKLVNDQGGYNTVTNITVDGGIWDSSPLLDYKDGIESFRFIHASNVTIKNAEFKNVPNGSHFIVFAGVADSKVENCSFHGYGTNTKNENGTIKPKEAIQIDIAHDNELVPTIQTVKWDDLACKNITISGCSFSECPRAIGSHTGVKGVFHDGIQITGNTITGMEDAALKLYNYMNTTISGNTITGGVEAIVVYTELSGSKDGDLKAPLNGVVTASPSNYNIVIQNNTISDVKLSGKQWGDAIRVSGSESKPMPGITITGNTISNVERYGIFVTQAPSTNVSGNTIIGSAKHGILLEKKCTNSAVNGNKITNSGESGIALYTGSDGTLVSGNTVETPADNGIYLYQVNGCTVGVDGTNFNTITSPKVSGVYVTQNSANNSINCNSIQNATKDGIVIYKSANNSVNSNSVQSAGKDGIWVSKATGTAVDGNTISAASDGIDINSASLGTVVKNNVIESAGECGIWLTGKSTGCSISGNTIKKYSVTAKKKNAIGVYQSGGTNSKNTAKIEKNVITGTRKTTGKDAVRISKSDYVKITGNTITSADGYGIYLYQCKNNAVSSNKITKSKKGGIYATTSCTKVKIQKNTVKSAGDTSIMVYKSPSATVSNNTVTTSKTKKGIYISNSNKTTIKSNKVTGAKKKNAIRLLKSTGCKKSSNTIK